MSPDEMKLKIQKTILENVLARSQSFINTKDTAEITSQVSLVAKDGILTIQATDYEIGLKTHIDNSFIINDGSVIVNGAKLLSSIKALKSGDIDLEVKNEILLINQGRSKFKLPLFANAIYPSFPSDENLGSLSISSTVMIESFRQIMSSIDTNNPKFELNGALVQIGLDSVDFASTDTRRLSLVSVESKSDKEFSLIVPKKAIVEMQKLFFEDVEMMYSDGLMIVKTSNTEFFTRLINGKFPEYQRIVPTETATTLTLQKLQLLEAIKQVYAISNDIKVIFKSDIIEIESLTNDTTEAKTAIDIETGINEDVEIYLNATYLVDFLNTIMQNDFSMGINDSNLPFVLKCDNLKTVVMPIVM